MRSKLLLAVLLPAVVGSAVWLAIGVTNRAAPKAHAADTSGERFWDTNCPVASSVGSGGQGNIDPIKFPGTNDVSHLHQFFGNQGLNPNSTGDSLLHQGGTPPGNEPLDGSHATCRPVGMRIYGDGTCTKYEPNAPGGTCPAEREKDKAAYWLPVLVMCPTNDPAPLLNSCPQAPLQSPTVSGLHVYYKISGDPAGANCTPGVGNCAQPFPVGFAQIAGKYRQDNANFPGGPHPDWTIAHQTNSTNQDPTSSHEWRCLADVGPGVTYENVDDNAVHSVDGSDHSGFVCGTADPNNPNKKATLRIIIRSAECWDGTTVNATAPLTDVGVNDHVRYKVNGVCAAPYNHLIPKLSIQEDFLVRAGVPQFFRLASTRINSCDPGTPPCWLEYAGSTSTAHADFVNAWIEQKQADLVRDCLNVPAYLSQARAGCQVSPS